MGSNEARIRLGVDGANDVRNALRLIKGDFSGMSADAKGLAQTLYGVGTGFVRLGVDVAKAANNMKAIDFGQAAEGYKKLDDQMTRMAIRGGKNIDDLKLKMRDYSKQVGASTGDFAGATKQFDRQTFAGVDESAEAMRSLGVYAEDTDRSLEEMIDLGADMWTKLGIPATKVEGELRKIQAIAGNTSLASGFLGLEDSFRRLMPLMQKFEGGATRGNATVATIQKQFGFSKEYAEQTYNRIFGALGDEQAYLLRQAAKAGGFKGDAIVRDPKTGRPMLAKQAMKAVQKYVKGKPLGGAGVYFGGGMEGEDAARVFRALNFREVDIQEDQAEYAEDYHSWKEEEAKKAAEEAALLARTEQQHRGGKGLGGAVGLFGKAKAYSKYSQTEAGRRSRWERGRADVENAAGKRVVQAQTQRQHDLTPTEAATVDTVTAYMPGPVQDVVHVGSAAVSERGNIAGALNRLTGAIDALPGKVRQGVEGATVTVKPPSAADIFPEKNRARVD